MWTRLFSKRVDLWVRNREKLLLCYTQVHYLCRQQPLGWCCFHLQGLSWYVCHLSKTLSRRHLLKREQAQLCFWFLCRNLYFRGVFFSIATLQHTITKLYICAWDQYGSWPLNTRKSCNHVIIYSIVKWLLFFFIRKSACQGALWVVWPP